MKGNNFRMLGHSLRLVDFHAVVAQRPFCFSTPLLVLPRPHP